MAGLRCGTVRECDELRHSIADAAATSIRNHRGNRLRPNLSRRA